MKLRIKNNTLRLRLSKSEISDLANNKTLTTSVGLSPQPLVFSLSAREAASIEHADNHLQFSMPLSVAQAFDQTDQVSYAYEAADISVLIEKDFVCLEPRTGEDETDNYPNPNSR